jgi:putative membrane protein
MLMVTGWLSARWGLGFTVSGFLPAFWGGLVIGLVSLVLSLLFSPKEN